MDTLTIPTDIFGSAPATFSPTKRLGSDASRLSQIQNGKWKVVGPYITDAVPTKK
jgi:branched-chain amino acid transport system substrate-binding protein